MQNVTLKLIQTEGSTFLRCFKVRVRLTIKESFAKKPGVGDKVKGNKWRLPFLIMSL